MTRILRTILCLVAVIIATTAAARERRAEVTFTTTEGTIVVELYNETTLHRDNFLLQVKNHLYDGVLFHRVINEFMIQGGDPVSKDAKPGDMLGEGTDTPDQWLPAEFRVPEFFHERGALAAAREGDGVNPEKKSSPQQFYIVTGRTFTDDQLDNLQKRISQMTHGQVTMTPEMREAYRTVGGAPHLDGSYTVFGRVTCGMEIVDSIQRVDTGANDRPLKDIRILKAKVTKKYKKVRK